MKNLKEDIKATLRTMYAKSVEQASTAELYNAISKAIMSSITDEWRKQKQETISNKRAYYLSAEFLVGRHINNNILNLDIARQLGQFIDEYKLQLGDFEEIEDCALGNGGLGRLAACFLESAATTGINLNGYGIRYKYGLFKQSFENGFQVEKTDDWTRFGDPWSERIDSQKVVVSFAGQKVYAVPYDVPVIGYKNGKVNTLRLWQSEPMEMLDFKEFNNMNYESALDEKNSAEIISFCLYPNDDGRMGKVLRLKQEYFFSSASIQDMLRKNQEAGKTLADFVENVTIQLNDTHPVIAIPELIRLLTKSGETFDAAFSACKKVFAFTNHTIMGEALEKWGVDLIQEVLPGIYEIICKIQERLYGTLAMDNVENKDNYYIISDGVIHMARLAVYVAKTTNGVAKIHTEILKADVFKDWYKIYPKRFQNKTNGISPRRWLLLANPKLTAMVEKYIGNGFKDDLNKLADLKKFVSDERFLAEFKDIKHQNKCELSDYIFHKEGQIVPPNMIFDIQIKRMHEYKRQLMNALSILYIYNEIKDGRLQGFKPTAFIFGAKAAPGYYNAKAIIKFINEIARMIESDEQVSKLIKVIFISNYNVSYAEKLVSGADISEQISTAGYEASGTGNMKFMLNGTVTLGTLDGANVEIVSEAGNENNYIFGATVQQINDIKGKYSPKEIYENNDKIKKIVDTLIDGTLDDGGSGMFKRLYKSIVESDCYFVLYDLLGYIEAKLKSNTEYGSARFDTMSVMNMASSGIFSSDRSIREYAKEIWDM